MALRRRPVGGAELVVVAARERLVGWCFEGSDDIRARGGELSYGDVVKLDADVEME